MKMEFLKVKGGSVWHIGKQEVNETLCSLRLGFFGDPGASVQAVIRSNELPLDMCVQCFNLVKRLLELEHFAAEFDAVTHTPPETADHLPLSYRLLIDLP